jgi:predicted membrane protein
MLGGFLSLCHMCIYIYTYIFLYIHMYFISIYINTILLYIYTYYTLYYYYIYIYILCAYMMTKTCSKQPIQHWKLFKTTSILIKSIQNHSRFKAVQNCSEASKTIKSSIFTEGSQSKSSKKVPVLYFGGVASLLFLCAMAWALVPPHGGLLPEYFRGVCC